MWDETHSLTYQLQPDEPEAQPQQQQSARPRTPIVSPVKQVCAEEMRCCLHCCFGSTPVWRTVYLEPKFMLIVCAAREGQGFSANALRKPKRKLNNGFAGLSWWVVNI